MPVIEVAEGVVDPRVILGLEAAAEDDMAARPATMTATITSTTISTPPSSRWAKSPTPADLVARIEHLADSQNILRVKGYAAVAGKPMRLLVQAVGARVRHQYDRPWGATSRASRAWW